MVEQPQRSIDVQAAQRWQRQLLPASPWLHEEVARRMQARLELIRLKPRHWLDWAALQGGLQGHVLVAQRYPDARCTLLEATPARARQLRACLNPAWWKPQRWLRGQSQIATEAPTGVDMLWANMALHLVAEPKILFNQWLKALAVDGFLMFSCLGPDTLIELRTLFGRLGWPAPSHEFTDMHDWGDLLLTSGFADPVLDMERITLSFATPQRLLRELRGLGRNLNVHRFAGLRGRRWQNELLEALRQTPLQLTFEVIYGHAIKPAEKIAVAQRSEISLSSMRAALAKGQAR